MRMALNDNGNINIHDLDTLTSLDIPPDRVLLSAVGALKSVCIVGRDKDGNLYVASSIADGPELLWDLQKATQKLLNVGAD